MFVVTDEPVAFTERVYVQPSSNVAPPAGSVLAPRFIRFQI